MKDIKEVYPEDIEKRGNSMKQAYYPTAILLIVLTFVEIGIAGYADYQLQVYRIQVSNGIVLLISGLAILLLVGLLFLVYLYRHEPRSRLLLVY